MRIFLAPMEGVVDHHLRSIYANVGGIDACVTEFIRISQTRLPQKVFKRACPELLQPIAIPVHVQLLGSEPELLAQNARKAAKLGAPTIDLNFGCPAKTVNKNRGGACLLDETPLIFDIVQAVREAVPTNIPVTAKIRLGYNERNSYLDNARAIEAAGANELFVHARSKQDGYKPPAYWHYIADIRQTVGIPVIANGEIWTVEDALRCIEQSGCEDLMLGRGLLANPNLASAIKKARGFASKELSAAEQWPQVLMLLEQFHQQTLDAYPLKHCGNRLKQWLMYLQRHFPQAKELFNQVKTSRDPASIEQCLSQAKVRANAKALKSDIKLTTPLIAPLDCA